MKYIYIILGSDSDIEHITSGLKILEEIGVEYGVSIISAHRLPDELINFVKVIERDGCEVIIAVAGASAHLPGVIASHTILPVIGVPVAATEFNGVDALLSMVEVPPPASISTMGIGKLGFKNAIFFALRILSIKHPDIRERLVGYISKMRSELMEKKDKIERLGVWKYIEEFMK